MRGGTEFPKLGCFYTGQVRIGVDGLKGTSGRKGAGDMDGRQGRCVPCGDELCHAADEESNDGA